MVIGPSGGSRTTRTLVTDSQGEFEFTHRPTRNTGYTAPGDEETYGDDAYAFVRPKVGLRVRSARLARFTVTIGAERGRLWDAFLQRRVTRTRWRTVPQSRGRDQVVVRNLSATFTARLPRGTQRVRIFVSKKDGFESAYSRVVLVRR